MKKYNIYSIDGNEWPSSLLSNFRPFYIEGVFFFSDGHPDEIQFQNHSLALKIDQYVSKTEHVAVDISEVRNMPTSYFYLSASSLDYSGPLVADLNTGCPLCKYAAVQVRKLALNPRLAARKDISMLFVRPLQLWVVSRRAKEDIQTAGLTGVRFAACLRSDRKYTKDECELGYTSERIEVEAEHYQMFWDRSMCVSVEHFAPGTICESCETCTLGSAMIGGFLPFISRDRLAQDDFFTFNEYITSTGEMFKTRGRFSVVSGRALDVILSKKLKGIDWPYSKNIGIDFRLLPSEDQLHFRSDPLISTESNAGSAANLAILAPIQERTTSVNANVAPALSLISDRVRLLDGVFLKETGLHCVSLPASDDQIHDLENFAGKSLPADYIEFLRISNGFRDLGDVDSVMRRSTVWRQYWPGCLILGSDGGEGKYVMDVAYDRGDIETIPILYFEDEGLELTNTTREWPSFSDFFLDVFTVEYLSR